MSKISTDIKFRCPCCQREQSDREPLPWEDVFLPECPECGIVMDEYRRVQRWELVKRFVRTNG